MTAALDLYLALSKYMKFMAFIRSSSPQTLRAYWSDFRQIFQIPVTDLSASWGPQGRGVFVAEGEPFLKAGPSVSESELLDLCRDAFNQWVSLSLASRNRKAATMKSFLSWAYAEKLIEHDLSDRIACPKVPRKLPHYLSVDEVVALLESFRTEPDPPEEVLVLLLYGGGLRISEACGLRWSDIDFDRRLARVMGKGSKERLVPLPGKTCDRMKALRDSRGGAFVFGDQGLSTRVAYNWIRARGEKAGLHHRLHPHALRHSYATHLLAGGANLRTLQELLGHESLRATERYTHLGIDQLARTLERHHPLGKGS